MKRILIYSAIITGFINIAYFLYQPYFKLSGLDTIYFGIVFAIFYIISAISSKYSYLIEEKVGEKYSLILLFIFIGISYLLMSNFIFLFSFIFAFLIQFIKGFSSIIISDYVHKLTDSDFRATIFSVKSLIEKLFFAIITPFIGWIVDIYTLKQALNISGIIVLIFGGITFAIFLKIKK